MEPEPEPVSPCLYVLAGWLLASAQLGFVRPAIDAAEAAARMPAGARRPAETDPDRMSPRELRQLPAIGPTRALAIAHARWESGLTGGPEAWEDIPGIGPETVRAIRHALDARFSVSQRDPRVARTP
jgi:hypothetical protein